MPCSFHLEINIIDCEFESTATVFHVIGFDTMVNYLVVEFYIMLPVEFFFFHWTQVLKTIFKFVYGIAERLQCFGRDSWAAIAAMSAATN